MIDKIFTQKRHKHFEFDEEVALVFDDMLDRSIPFYEQNLDLCIALAKTYLNDKDLVYDLGCSTGSCLIKLAKQGLDLDLHGIDNSSSMLEIARKKAQAFGERITFIEADIFSVDLKKSKVIFASYTLQFIRPLQRQELISKIFQSLEDGGVFIFCEKVISENKDLNKKYIEKYYQYKEDKGYSRFEIAQKRQALEDVLIPYTVDENKKMLKKAGFSHSELIFKWANFASFIAIK